MTEHTMANGDTEPMPEPSVVDALRELLTTCGNPKLDDPDDAVAAAAFEQLQDARTRAQRILDTEDEAEAAEIMQDAIQNLRGDLSADLVAEVKRYIDWSKKSEAQQKEVIQWANRVAARLTGRAARITAARDSDSLEVKIVKGSWDADKITAAFAFENTSQHWEAIEHCRGKTVLLVPVEIDEFMGARFEIQADRDQPGLPLEQPAAAAPEHANAAAYVDQVAGAPVDGAGEPIPHDQKTGEVIEPPAPPAQTEPAAAVA